MGLLGSVAAKSLAQIQATKIGSNLSAGSWLHPAPPQSAHGPALPYLPLLRSTLTSALPFLAQCFPHSLGWCEGQIWPTQLLMLAQPPAGVVQMCFTCCKTRLCHSGRQLGQYKQFAMLLGQHRGLAPAYCRAELHPKIFIYINLGIALPKVQYFCLCKKTITWMMCLNNLNRIN